MLELAKREQKPQSEEIERLRGQNDELRRRNNELLREIEALRTQNSDLAFILNFPVSATGQLGHWGEDALGETS